MLAPAVCCRAWLPRGSAPWLVSLFVAALACSDRRSPAPSRQPLPAASTPEVASARPPPQLPLLQGRLRCEAVVALDARSELKLGSPRRYTLDELRAAAGDSMLVDGRRTWTLQGSSITLRAEALHREVDGSYRFDACEAKTKVEWRNAAEMVVASDIEAKARFGKASREGHRASLCSVALPAGRYRIVSEAGELLARRDDADGAWAFLLAPDAGVDFEAEALRLAGLGAR